ncbi:hypothetical protein LguiB_001157 [Lonicera macranthoides]
MEILIRFPLDCVLECQTVCKKWQPSSNSGERISALDGQQKMLPRLNKLRGLS